MGNSHVDTKPREHSRALDAEFFIATITATPEPGSTSGFAKSAIRNTEALVGILTSLPEEFPGKTGHHASSNHPTFALDRQVVGMDDKASLRELSSVEIRNVIEIGVHGHGINSILKRKQEETKETNRATTNADAPGYEMIDR